MLYGVDPRRHDGDLRSKITPPTLGDTTEY
jgi:hypothetical protein